MEGNEWIFTFRFGQLLAGRCIRIAGTYDEARAKMCEQFGSNWAFQYSAKEWDEKKKDPNRMYPMEKEIDLNEIRTDFYG